MTQKSKGITRLGRHVCCFQQLDDSFLTIINLNINIHRNSVPRKHESTQVIPDFSVTGAVVAELHATVFENFDNVIIGNEIEVIIGLQLQLFVLFEEKHCRYLPYCRACLDTDSVGLLCPVVGFSMSWLRLLGQGRPKTFRRCA